MKADKKKLELEMARACMNPGDLAKAAGVPRTTLNNFLRGNNPRPATLGRVAKALGVDPSELIAKEGE